MIETIIAWCMRPLFCNQQVIGQEMYYLAEIMREGHNIYVGYVMEGETPRSYKRWKEKIENVELRDDGTCTYNGLSYDRWFTTHDAMMNKIYDSIEKGYFDNLMVIPM